MGLTGIVLDATFRLAPIQTSLISVDVTRAMPTLTRFALRLPVAKARESREALTAKEKVVHEHGLVGVLKSLHDELDAAVLQAYGWTDLTLPADTDTMPVSAVMGTVTPIAKGKKA